MSSTEHFNIEKCRNAKNRWNIHPKTLKEYDLEKIIDELKKINYKVVAKTVTIVVMVSEDSTFRITWHKDGLIQIDSKKGELPEEEINKIKSLL